MTRARILVGVPLHKPAKHFLESLPKFINELVLSYDLKLVKVEGKSLVEAQNELADMLVNGEFTHLLFMEEDHWDHSIEMFNSMLEADTYVASVDYHSRHKPYPSILMRYNKQGQLDSIRETSGNHECDLVGFGFTLIRQDTFEYLDKPYFRLNKPNDVFGDFATDRNFFNRLSKNGIKPVGCADYCLTHRGLNRSNIKSVKFKSSHTMQGYISDKLFEGRMKKIINKRRKQDANT